MTVSGRVLGFDGRYLRLGTESGEVTLDYAAVTCEGEACPDPETFVPELRLSGAPRLGEVLLPALIEGFAFAEGYAVSRDEEGPGRFTYVLSETPEGPPVQRFSFRLTTTDEGLEDLLTEKADVLLAVRELRADEQEAAQVAGLGDLGAPEQARIVALDGLVPIVSPGREREAIDLTDLARVFGGEIDDWSDLGDAPGPVRLHLGDPMGGEMQGFAERVVRAAGLELSADIVVHPSPRSVAAAVAADPAALGIVPYQSYGNARPLAVSGRCGRQAEADLLSLKTEDYPLTLPLFLYLPRRRLPDVTTEFLAWLRTERAQFVVRRAGFVDLGAEPIGIDAQGQRLAAAILEAGEEVSLGTLQAMVRRLAGRDRLSTTFRFEEGETRLDAQSRSNVYQLARGIRDGRHDGKVLLLAGFSDGRGPALANRALAAARAEAVQQELVTALGGSLPEGVRVRTVAFGEALPMGCDDTGWGRQINRRVELWVER
ncbi:OmpA family protein [Histidinibacterium aquaticum]|uniref:OmpA family protein n=2 Tax=Histidinibacterium aquaticum TaxID=2613962 RepID=A0A5J5GG44_9RHOB|nr:OmpA family protein [Histidinibacterium aquaticum]